jgi:hypothetical protein
MRLRRWYTQSFLDECMGPAKVPQPNLLQTLVGQLTILKMTSLLLEHHHNDNFRMVR